MTTMTYKEYKRQPKDYRGYVDGIPYLLQNDPITGGTFYGPVTIRKQLKHAWHRDETITEKGCANGRISCDCGNAPLSIFDPSQPDIICNCGKRYSWEGCIKGRSIGSEKLTAYRVIFEDDTEYATSMSENTNLQDAYYYFMNRVIDGKLVVNVEPCEGE